MIYNVTFSIQVLCVANAVLHNIFRSAKKPSSQKWRVVFAPYVALVIYLAKASTFKRGLNSDSSRRNYCCNVM